MLSINSEHFYDFGNTTTAFYEDSTFISSEFAEDGNDKGTWSIVGDSLKITIELEVEEDDGITNVDTTISFLYVNYGNTFNISQSIDICEGLLAEGTDDEVGCDDVLGLFEALLDMDEGSIDEAVAIFQLFFEKIPDEQIAKMSNEPNNSWIGLLPQRIQQSIIRSAKQSH